MFSWHVLHLQNRACIRIRFAIGGRLGEEAKDGGARGSARKIRRKNVENVVVGRGDGAWAEAKRLKKRPKYSHVYVCVRPCSCVGV